MQKNPQLNPLKRSPKCTFFNQLSFTLSSLVSFWGFGACLVWEYGSRAAITQSSTERHHENVAWVPSTIQNGSNTNILGLFGEEFHKENQHFRG